MSHKVKGLLLFHYRAGVRDGAQSGTELRFYTQKSWSQTRGPVMSVGTTSKAPKSPASAQAPATVEKT